MTTPDDILVTDSATARLVSVASPGLSEADVPHDHVLRTLLGRRNGFYAFVSSLHVFPYRSDESETSLEEWNREDGWRSAYPALGPEFTAFAEDVFGHQFLLSPAGIHFFDPETAEIEVIAEDIESWCQLILDDAEYQTGFPLARQWQEEHGPIPSGSRLVPAIPFVLGGEFSSSNLKLMDAAESMVFRADLAAQVQDLPDGSRMVLTVTP